MSLGKLMIVIASNGHFFTHMPHPIHSYSLMKQIVEVALTSIQILPILLRGQVFAHSCLHFFGLHLSGLIMAILSFPSSVILAFFLSMAVKEFLKY